MRIGVLTVPFNNNYGGFLQAFALKSFLESIGHQVTIINRRRDWEKESVIKKTKKYFLGLIGKKNNISVYTDVFVEKYLSPITESIYSTKGLKKNDFFDYYIVGSDQVWRYKYATTSITNYFFDFLEYTNKPRISYAASFGVNFNEYDDFSVRKCSDLLKMFNSISVREVSGISLLRNVFLLNSDIQHVLDPTMLLDKSVYIDLAKVYPISSDDKYIFTYILDIDSDKQDLVERVLTEKHIHIKSINNQVSNVQSVVEPVEKWLSCLINSSFVITDSFHGMVFSLIFNKPFIVYVNRNRGADRFESLLSLLNLQNCMIDNSKDYMECNFDWDRINRQIDIYRKQSENFLLKSLEKNEKSILG